MIERGGKAKWRGWQRFLGCALFASTRDQSLTEFNIATSKQCPSDELPSRWKLGGGEGQLLSVLLSSSLLVKAAIVVFVFVNVLYISKFTPTSAKRPPVFRPSVGVLARPLIRRLGLIHNNELKDHDTGRVFHASVVRMFTRGQPTTDRASDGMPPVLFMRISS